MQAGKVAAYLLAPPRDRCLRLSAPPDRIPGALGVRRAHLEGRSEPAALVFSQVCCVAAWVKWVRSVLRAMLALQGWKTFLLAARLCQCPLGVKMLLWCSGLFWLKDWLSCAPWHYLCLYLLEILCVCILLYRTPLAV